MSKKDLKQLMGNTVKEDYVEFKKGFDKILQQKIAKSFKESTKNA